MTLQSRAVFGDDEPLSDRRRVFRFRHPIATRSHQMYTFEVKIRLAGRVSYVEVTASDSAHARLLVAAQYGDAVTILQTKRLR